MTTNHGATPATDPHGWWENQITLHPPKSPEVAAVMDDVRGYFRTLGDLLIERLPPGPDLTVALRELKSASALAIGCIACHQDHWPDPKVGDKG